VGVKIVHDFSNLSLKEKKGASSDAPLIFDQQLCYEVEAISYNPKYDCLTVSSFSNSSLVPWVTILPCDKI
jgi:hypothetical protein